MLIDDQRLTFIEGTVRRSIGGALIEVGAARESNGGTAAHAQLLGKFGPVNVSAEALLANDFHLHGGAKRRACAMSACALDVPLKLGKRSLPAHADVHLPTGATAPSQLDAAARLSANFDRFNLATDLIYRSSFWRRARRRPASSTSA